MKSILYVGATLMIGASIYGFVDYKQTQNKKEFKKMFVEEKEKVPAVVADNKLTGSTVKKEAESPERKSKDRIASKNKKVVTQKQVVDNDEAIFSIKPIAEDERIASKETNEIEKSSVDLKPSKESGVEKKVKKKRKLSTKLFSRGALDERYTEPKEEVKKVKN